MPEIFSTLELVEMCIDEAEAINNRAEELIREYKETPVWRVVKRWRLVSAASQDALTAQYLARIAKSTLATIEV